jgi:hypothetical protein
MSLSGLVKNMISNDKIKLPYLNDSMNFDYVVDGLFNVDYYTKTIMTIFDFIEKTTKFSKELLSITPTGPHLLNLDHKEFELLKNCNPGKLSQEEFLNTHYVLFNFFNHYDFSLDGINYGINILAKLFAMYYTGDIQYNQDFFGYSFNKGYVEKIIRNIPSRTNNKYLYYNFVNLPFWRSYNILIKSDYDPSLGYFTQYFKADGKYCSVLPDDTHYYAIETFGINDFDYPEISVNKLVISGTKTIKEINFKSISSLIVLNSLETIGNNFMIGSTSLKSVDLSNTLLRTISKNFMYKCENLGSITFPKTLTTIDDVFMHKCNNLETINLSNTSLTTINHGFAIACKKLKTVTFPNTLKTIGGNFMGSLDKSHYSEGNTNLKSLNMSNTSITTINSGFMENCINLESISLPKTLTTIGNSFMHKCKNLETIDLSNTVITTVGDDFMSECVNLESISLPNTLTIIGSNFMLKCSNLETINLLNTELKKIGSGFMIDCENLKSVYILKHQKNLLLEEKHLVTKLKIVQ